MIAKLKEFLAAPDPALGYINGGLRASLGSAQQVAGDTAAAKATLRQARTELEPFLKGQPENTAILYDVALITALDWGLPHRCGRPERFSPIARHN
jgi:hypothetical protein